MLDPFGVDRANVVKGASPEGEAFLPAYTLERHKLTGKERRRQAIKRAAGGATTSAAVSAAATGALTRNPRVSAQAAAAGGGIGALLGAASTPKTEYRMRRVHGISAKPTAPGQSPKILLRKKPTEYVGKKDTSSAFEPDRMTRVVEQGKQTRRKTQSRLRIWRSKNVTPKERETVLVERYANELRMGRERTASHKRAVERYKVSQGISKVWTQPWGVAGSP